MSNFLDLLSPEDLDIEKCRLKTFDKKWPHLFISPKILAKIGFYYVGPHDEVRCHFCKVEISNWEMGDNEITEHERWAFRLVKKECPLLTRKYTRNIPLEPVSELNELLSTATLRNEKFLIVEDILETPNSYFEQTQQINSMGCSKSLGPPIDGIILKSELNRIVEMIDAQFAKFPEMETETQRLETFEGWPHKNQTPKQLSESGFFFTQKEDRVICFSCGGGLCDWQESDDPWEQHALWYPSCYFLVNKKGPSYSKMIGEKHKQDI